MGCEQNVSRGRTQAAGEQRGRSRDETIENHGNAPGSCSQYNAGYGADFESTDFGQNVDRVRRIRLIVVQAALYGSNFPLQRGIVDSRPATGHGSRRSAGEG